MICERYRRQVVSGYICDGDPNSTCAAYGCGRPGVVRRLVEVYGDGRRATLVYCDVHQPRALA